MFREGDRSTREKKISEICAEGCGRRHPLFPTAGNAVFQKPPIMKKSGSISPWLCAAAFVLLTHQGRAATIAQYVFADTYTNSEPLPAGIQSAGGITFAAGLTDVSGATGISTNPDDTLFIRSTVVRQTTIANAITADDYFSFQVTITPGFSLDLSSVSVDHWTANTYTSYLSVFYTTGATDFPSEAVAVNLGEQSTNSATSANQTFTGNLSGNENLTGTVRFHFLFRDPNNANLMNYVTRLDNITLDGVVSPIPEPTAAHLALLALAFPMIRRRR